MKKKTLAVMLVAGMTLISSYMTFAQIYERGASSKPASQSAVTPPAAPSGVIVIPPQKGMPPLLTAYIYYTALQSSAGNLSTLIGLAESSACPQQLSVYTKAQKALDEANNGFAAAWKEYQGQAALPRDLQDWHDFYVLANAVFANLSKASEYFTEATQTPCWW